MTVDIAIEEIKNLEAKKLSLLEKFETLYLEAVERNRQYCNQCKEWLELDLPVDCLCKPDYCIRKESDSTFVFLYEELQNNLY